MFSVFPEQSPNLMNYLAVPFKRAKGKLYAGFGAMSALACALVTGLSAIAEARSLHDRLRSCLELKDMTKQRVDCYDAILPPQPDPMPLPAKVVTDCRFSKDENERLTCFNQFAEKPAKPVVPKATSAAPAAPKPVEPTLVVPNAPTTGARTR